MTQLSLKSISTLRKYRIAVSLLAVVLIAAVFSGSLVIYDYTEHDPAFCASCHIMDSAFESWEGSIHREVECHDCHYATALERNRMLIKTLIEKSQKVSERPHEKIIVPSTMCIKCHWEGEKDIPKISKSTGHALHWFKGGIECTACHAIALHKFEAEQRLCENCHGREKTLLPKMQDMLCTQCHNFRQGKLVPNENVCAECHSQVKRPTAENRTKAHQQFDCMTCHHTHDLKRPASSSCENCHFLTMKRGKHPIHLDALENDCLSCHQSHQWHITEKESKILCSQCHDLYSLKTFQ